MGLETTVIWCVASIPAACRVPPNSMMHRCPLRALHSASASDACKRAAAVSSEHGFCGVRVRRAMCSLDGSATMRNGDYYPSRLRAQYDAAIMVIETKLQAHGQSTVGLVMFSGRGCVPLASMLLAATQIALVRATMTPSHAVIALSVFPLQRASAGFTYRRRVQAACRMLQSHCRWLSRCVRCLENGQGELPVLLRAATAPRMAHA